MNDSPARAPGVDPPGGDPPRGDPPGVDLPGVDLAALTAYLAPRLDLAGPLAASLIHGGRSNLTYRLTDGAHQWVLRRPPLGSTLQTAHDMAREYRVIDAVHGRGVPTPAPVLLCRDRSVLGVDFYIMDYVEGTVLRGAAQARLLTQAQAALCADALIEVLISIHRVDTGLLPGFGRPDGYLNRQVSRWQRQWELSATRVVADIDELTGRLSPRIPRPQATALVHGDYRLDNVIFDSAVSGSAVSDSAVSDSAVSDSAVSDSAVSDSAVFGAGGVDKIAAVVDWELATLGDPLADLGLLLVYWDPLTAGVTGTEHAVTGNRGFPSSAELAAAYARATGLDLSALGFYVALGYLKLAVIAEGIHARFLAGHTVGPGFETVGDAVPALAAAGLAALAP